MSLASRQLPLFPLHTVLLPGGMLPLHIFEPRYRQMVQLCLAADRRFGVVLIAEGTEVGGPARPYPVGTVARIAVVEPLSEGRFNLMVVGEQRFVIERSWPEADGYLVGQVQLLDEATDRDAAELVTLVGELRSVLVDYVGQVAPKQPALQQELARLDDPLRLSGLAASLLRGDNERKQQLLQVDSLPARLRQLLALLRNEMGLLRLLQREPPTTLKRDIISPN